MSFDMRLMFVFHIAMIVMLVTSAALTVAIEAAVAGGLAVVLAAISVMRRRKLGWRWSGAGPLKWLLALGALAAGLLFVGVAAINVPPTSPAMLPWFLAAAGIFTFNLLSVLGIVHQTEAAFEASCGPGDTGLESGDALVETRRRTWRDTVVGLYRVVFIAVWLEAMAFFAAYGLAVRDGASQPSVLAAVPLTDHGRTVYLPVWQGDLVEQLRTAMMIGIPSMMVLGLLLHLGLGVKVFDNLATWRREDRL